MICKQTFMPDEFETYLKVVHTCDRISSPCKSLFFKLPAQNIDEQSFPTTAAWILYMSCDSVSRNCGIIAMIAVSFIALEIKQNCSWKNRKLWKEFFKRTNRKPLNGSTNCAKTELNFAICSKINGRRQIFAACSTQCWPYHAAKRAWCTNACSKNEI